MNENERDNNCRLRYYYSSSCCGPSSSSSLPRCCRQRKPLKVYCFVVWIEIHDKGQARLGQQVVVVFVDNVEQQQGRPRLGRNLLLLLCWPKSMTIIHLPCPASILVWYKRNARRKEVNWIRLTCWSCRRSGRMRGSRRCGRRRRRSSCSIWLKFMALLLAWRRPLLARTHTVCLC